MPVRDNAASRRLGGLFRWIALPGSARPLNLLATAMIAALLGFMAASGPPSLAVLPPFLEMQVTTAAPCDFNGVCGPGEGSCAAGCTDCCPPTQPPGQPPPDTGCNNNGICEPERQEGTYNCGDCPSFCGDQICAASEVNNCCGDGKDCTVQITCGDGLCSACENSQNCSRDCVGPTVTTPAPGHPRPTEEQQTAEPTDTDTPTPTLTNTPTDTPSFTPTFTDTPARTAEATDQSIATPTARPTQQPPTQGLPPFVIALLAVLGAGGSGFLLFFFTRRRKEDDDE